MGQGYIFASERFICMVTYIFFLNSLFLHSNVNNKVDFVKFSTPDFVEIYFEFFFSKSEAVVVI